MKTESLKKVLNEVQRTAEESANTIVSEVHLSNGGIVTIQLCYDNWSFFDEDTLCIENNHGKHFLNVADVVRVSI